MVATIRKYHNAAFKKKVALAALKGDKTATELSQDFGVAPSQISTWKQQLENGAEQIFTDKRKKENQMDVVDKLHKVIGRITVERDFLADVLNRYK